MEVIELIALARKAYKAKDDAEYKRLCDLIDHAQEECTHPPEFRKDIHVGGYVAKCMVCHKGFK